MHERYRRQTDGRQHIANVNVSSRSLKMEARLGYTLEANASRKTGIGRGVPLRSRVEDMQARCKLPNLKLDPAQSPGRKQVLVLFELELNHVVTTNFTFETF